MINQEKKFTVIGTATSPGGVIKVHWANDFVGRIKILNKAGFTKIDFKELPRPMTKLESLDYIKNLAIDADISHVISTKYQEKLQQHNRKRHKEVLQNGK